MPILAGGKANGRIGETSFGGVAVGTRPKATVVDDGSFMGVGRVKRNLWRDSWIGGIALVLGIYASWAAVPLAIEMLGIVFFHAPNGFAFTNPNGGWEFPALWFVALVVVFLMGDGAWALAPKRRPDAPGPAPRFDIA